MELSFLGGKSFKFKTKTLTLVIDPMDSSEKADVVVYTHASDIKITAAVNREKTFVIDREGEYELGGVGIVVDRIASGEMVVRVNCDGVEVADASALSQLPEEKMLEKLRDSDVAILPLDKAIELIEKIEPYIAVLANYKEASEVEQFLGSHKFEVVRREDKLKLDANSLPENTEVVVLNA